MDGIALVAALLGAIWPTGVVIALLRRTAPVTLADLVTFGRVLLTGVICAAAVFVFAGALPERTWTVAILTGAALLLDAVDGQVARRTGTSTASGARFDMEADAVLLLVLSVLAALTVGWWVVAMGLLRYLFVVAGWIRPRLRGDLPFDQSRRVIAATQGVVLLVVLLPLTPLPVAIACAAVALGLLIWSFARDIVRLERSERSEHEYA